LGVTADAFPAKAGPTGEYAVAAFGLQSVTLNARDVFDGAGFSREEASVYAVNFGV
jgi:hypothetical protein